jgi:membrane associated rhomboid family serine protease
MPLRRVPLVTYFIVALNVALFLAEPINKAPLAGVSQTAPAACRQVQFFEQYGAVPAELIHNRKLPQLSVEVLTSAGPVTCSVGHQTMTPILSVLTSMFLHAGWAHLLGNMLFLLVFGNNVEDRLGRVRFPLFYLASGFVAAYGFALAYPNSTEPLIGASGAIAGCLGAYLVLYPRTLVTTLIPPLLFLPLRLPAWLVLGFWFLLQYAYSSGSGVAQGANVAYFAHVCGFLFGATVIRLIAPSRRARRSEAWWS